MANLINSSADLKANFSSLSLNFTWANVSSFAVDIEFDTIGPVISPEALAVFQASITSGAGTPPAVSTTTLAGVQLQALTWLQRAVSYLTILKWSQTALFQFEDKALFVAKSTNGAIISDKKLTDLRQHCEEEGFKFLDKAIDLMEANLGSFIEYRDSDTREALNQCFIQTAIDFSRQRNINNSRLTFLSMFYFMVDIQEDKLPDILTPVYYPLFKAGFLAGTLIDVEQAMLPFIKKAIAMFSIAQACNELPVQIKSGGIFVNRYFNSIDYGMKDPAAQIRLQFLADDHTEKGESWLVKLQDYITTNGASLPDYVVPDVIPDCDVNDCDSGIYNPY